MQWLNEPLQWSQSGRQIIVRTSSQTDFWRITHYGFIRDTGHFYYERVATDCRVEVTIRGRYQDLYDQAGLMLRADEQNWIKTGIEYVDGIQHLSAVVTRNYSDWSFIPLPHPPEVLKLRLERRGETVHIAYQDESLQYIPFRMAYFPALQEIQVGIMCASPQGKGYDVVFEDYQLCQQLDG
uniref:DUF1349 domain-containing protein n=1 Tax=Cyanothece sp. (strain PCC 7425 / ATCC 29141) TaxID=395961 RepID=B8HL45_CYAP4